MRVLFATLLLFGMAGSSLRADCAFLGARYATWVFEGTGGIALLDSFKRGIVGTMPGADLIRAIVPLWRALQAGDSAKADRIHGPLAALISMQTSLDAFLAVEKHLLVRQGIFKNTLVRGPVGFRLDDETRREVDRLFDRLMESAG